MRLATPCPLVQAGLDDVHSMAREAAPTWGALLNPGHLALLDGAYGHLRVVNQELTHFAVHHRQGVVLWCDGDHGFNPYDFANMNLERGFDGDWGADRVLVKRCMTPFQWDTVLTKHLAQRLEGQQAGLVLVAPFDALYSTDELEDWERRDYVEFALRHLKGLAVRHEVPIVLAVDMGLWWVRQPMLARIVREAATARWRVEPSGDGWAAREELSAALAGRAAVRQSTLRAFTAAPPRAAPAAEPPALPRLELPALP